MKSFKLKEEEKRWLSVASRCACFFLFKQRNLSNVWTAMMQRNNKIYKIAMMTQKDRLCLVLSNSNRLIFDANSSNNLSSLSAPPPHQIAEWNDINGFLKSWSVAMLSSPTLNSHIGVSRRVCMWIFAASLGFSGLTRKTDPSQRLYEIMCQRLTQLTKGSLKL